ncbi:twitching motility protein PilT [Pollutimonas subterranea]|uniref:Twitching motility protein PilT n=1 Tax=Pollutimonas subterranea TaxID=2045210 RepID=A0A2N4U6V5_9BURK|nr:type II toxin-antitoxin system VapC family toxin [Pollutimonas subterranea]PLC50752.1 twitching motility protein PilT [Pollutimonas subterranea]
MSLPSRHSQLARAKDKRFFITITVMLELEWVLRSRYQFDKPSVTAALDALMTAAELEFQHESALEKAIWFFKQKGSPDFADCLHVALVRQAAQVPFLTFDRQASSLDGATLPG